MSIVDTLSEENPEAILFDGFEDALVGISYRFGLPPLACYDMDLCIEVLTRDMPYPEAVEYFQVNVIGTWAGEHTPVFISQREDG